MQASLAFESTARRDFATISLVGLGHGTSHFFHLMLPPLFPWLMRDFGLNFTQAGALMSVFFLVSGVGQALAGFVVDRFGARRVLFAGLATLAASGLALALAQNYAMLMLAAAIAGAGNSVFHPADFTLLNRRVAQPRLGHAFSVHGLSGNLGWAAAPAFMAGIAAVAGWRAAGLGAALVGVAVLGFLYLQRGALALEQAALAPGDKRAHAAGGTFAFLRVPAVWLCFAFFLFVTCAFSALQNFSAPLLGQLYGLTLAAATSALSGYLLGGAAGIALGGFIAARATHDRVVAVALTCAALLAALLATQAPPAWTVVPLMALMGFATGIASPSRDLLVRKAATGTLGQAAFGRVYGFVYSGLDVGFALAPLMLGPLMDAGRFTAVMAGVAVFQTAAIFTALTVGARSRVAAAPVPAGR